MTCSEISLTSYFPGRNTEKKIQGGLRHAQCQLHVKSSDISRRGTENSEGGRLPRTVISDYLPAVNIEIQRPYSNSSLNA